MPLENKSGYNSLNRVKQELEKGHQGKAIDLALRYFSRDFSDPELYYEWGKTFELLGLAKKAIESYGFALKLSPNNPHYLKSLAILLYETGLLEKAFSIFKKLTNIVPNDEEINAYWINLLEELGLKGASESLKGIEKKASPLRYFPPSLGKEEIEIFLRLFSGRERGFAEQILDKKTALSRLIFYDFPLTPEFVRAHILSEKTIFFFPLREDKRMKMGIIAFFISKRERFLYARQPAYLTLKSERLKAYCLKVQEIVNKTFEIPGYLEKVNRFFYRLWIFLEEFIHFLQIKRFLKEIIQKLPYPEFGIAVEPLLPTRPIGVGWQERPIFLPLGINRETKERSLFINEDGEFYREQIRFLKKIKEISHLELKAFVRRNISGIESKTEDEVLEKLRKSCLIIDTLVNKAEAGRVLEHKEKLILFYTLGLVDKKLLHKVLYPTPDYNAFKVERILRAMKKNPISCVKIREFLPELSLSLDCHCVFDLSDGRYPSPLLHINPYLVPSEDYRLTLQRSSFNKLVKVFIELYQQREGIDRKLRQIEGELAGVFSKKGLKEYTIEGMTLVFDGGNFYLRRE